MDRLLPAVLALFISYAANAAELAVTLPKRDALVLQVPSGWTHQINRPRADLPPTIVFSSSEPMAFQVLITPIWPVGNAPPPDRNNIRRLVEGAAKQAAAQSVEREIPLQELSGAGRFGYYFSATDRNPKHDEYKFLTQGALGYGELRITFTVLANGKPQPVVIQTLELLRTLQRSRGTAGAI